MDIKRVLAGMGVHNVGTLETMAKEFLKNLPAEDRKALRQHFNKHRTDEAFQDLVESSYKEIEDEIDHR
jgi:hypothetical protein